MLRPFLLVGVGGSGGKTLRGVRKALQLKLEQEKWHGGWPDAWQLLHIDSPVSQDGLDFPAPLLPKTDYLSLVPSGVGYEVIFNSIEAKMSGEGVRDLERALPSPQDVTVSIYTGAGAFRGVGRAISAASLGPIQAGIASMISRMQTGTASAQLAELSRHLGIPISGKLHPTIILVSSIAGGSGAGQYMDVAEAIKSAAGNQIWTEDMFALLYAPDVFSKIDSKALAPNALGAIAEAMSGFWNPSPSESTKDLYRGNGLIASSSTKYRIGPAFPYIIGRKNGVVDFDDQSDVYLAVASSIATWMTDHKVQDKLSSVTVSNYQSNAPTLPDNTGLRRNGLEAAPFSSMGFGRVSLGLERFFEYSAERLAKSALENLLNKHTSTDRLLAQKTEKQWRNENADLGFPGFLKDSGLDQQTRTGNQVLAKIRSEPAELLARMKSSIEQAARGGMPQGGHSFGGWVERIHNAYEVNLPSILDENRVGLLGQVREWVDLMPGKTLALVAETISRQGLPVTLELISRTIQHSQQAGGELKREHDQLETEAASVKNQITQEMQSASSMAAIPPGNPAVAKGVHQAQIAVAKRFEADLRENAAEIVSDFVSNFLEPLRQTLAAAANVLRANVNDPKLADGRGNPYSSWPSYSDTTVPPRFRPAPNERLLIDYKAYAKKFDELVKQTVSDPGLDAKRVLLDEFTMGTYGVEGLKDLRQDQQWRFIEPSQIWVPQKRDYQSKEGAYQAAKFEFLSDHVEYVQRAKLWLLLPGRTFASYLDQTLAEWLGNDSDKATQARNHMKFLKEFDAAVAGAKPLVEKDPKLSRSAHGAEAEEIGVLFSPIPVAEDDALFEPLKAVLSNYEVWDDSSSPKWFAGASGASNVRQIDIFSMTSFPVQPMTLRSVMDPIAKEWLVASKDDESRSNFMRWRRGRPLPESLPVSPSIWPRMLSGFYVAKLFGLIKHDEAHAAFGKLGPKLSMWIDGGKKHVDFPFPLHFPGVAARPDYLGIIMESLIIALVNCYSEGSLEPLEPYKKLATLGTLGNLDGRGGVLQNWVRTGEITELEAPEVDASRAGSREDTTAERKAKCVQFFTKQLESFEAYMSRQDPFGDVRAYPVSWELRREIRQALNELIFTIPTFEEQDEDDF
jgi:hypothetical protein